MSTASDSSRWPRRQWLQGAALLMLVPVRHALGAAIVAVRVWPARDYTRVTIESEQPLPARHQLVDNPPRLVIDVVDTGIGMTPEQAARLFQPFVQGAAGEKSKTPGAGLGLALSKQLVESMGGSIDVASDHPRGALVWFTARVRRVESPAEASPRLETVAHDVAPKLAGRVLVVEDEASLRDGIVDLLTGDGHQVAAAADGVAGLEAGLRDAFDVVVLDLMLPRLDGMEVCRRLRAARPGTPILLLTARGSEDDKVRGLMEGADDYVTKPFSVAELIARINAIFRRQARLSSHHDETFTIGTWQINARKHTMSRGRTSKRLTFYELEVLKLLRERADATVSRDELLEKVWGIQASPTSRIVDNFIVKLRRKLEEDQKSPRHILTVYGMGYKLVP